MATKVIDLTLPEWAWLSGGEHEKCGDPLEGRNVVYHIRSASVIEFLEQKNYMPSGNVRTYGFTYQNAFGNNERHVAVLHYSATTDCADTLDEILRAAAQWYCDYLHWEDKNIISGQAALN